MGQKITRCSRRQCQHRNGGQGTTQLQERMTEEEWVEEVAQRIKNIKNKAARRWAVIMQKMLERQIKEARDEIARWVRKHWAHFGKMLRKHPWVVEYREENYDPVYRMALRKQWKAKK